ncbi:ATP-dependent RNA helicase FAL1 [Histomonas meleagridis]|uniref:ATP-dependent RNA helicase FAL1 n=1 Tax=Histomonas meleagridis TaxID=135588 RepID=UPI00355AB2A4|nr:ATP-dependent RNA helicase FAL1 [Histomonas meleagridis]KAH0797185.1 ATP-dependent RNA helicase FAL1 [Histomonas meleagridis]
MINEERAFQATQNIKVYDTWESMNLKPELLDAILKLGWTKPSPVQSRAIIPISQGKSMVLQSQNGTGKTATFSIGSLQRLKLTSKFTELIVISPTRELALQSENTLKSLGAQTRSCIGGNSLGEDVKALKKGIHCVSGTPGRILQLLREHNIDYNKVKIVVLDEADEMLTSFKRTITDILTVLQPAKPQIVVVTATVSEDVIELYTGFLPRGLNLLVPRDELSLSNVNQYIVRSAEEFKFDALIDLYQSVAIERAVIFVNTRDKGTWLKNQMVSSGFTVSLAHGQLSMEEREQITADFRNGETRVLIATDVWARGIDVRNVTLVINFDIPTQCETYLHRIGRSGRFGRKGIAITFCAGSGDEKKIQKIQKYYDSVIQPLPSDLDSLFF